MLPLLLALCSLAANATAIQPQTLLVDWNTSWMYWANTNRFTTNNAGSNWTTNAERKFWRLHRKQF